MCCAKTAEPSKMLFELLTLMGQKNHILDGGGGLTLDESICISQVYTSAMWPCYAMLQLCSYHCPGFNIIHTQMHMLTTGTDLDNGNLHIFITKVH